jgi:hypothetical protein
MSRRSKRAHLPAKVNPVADRILALVKDDPELRDADREILRCAFLTLAYWL